MHKRICEGGTKFFFNGDLSGNLHIYPEDPEGEAIIIPAKDILELIAREYVIPKRVARLEEMDDFDVLFNHLIENLG